MSEELVERQDEPEAWEKPFLEALVNEYGVEGRAARAVGVHPNAVERRAKESPGFKALLAAARKIVDDTLEFEGMRRALEPAERPIFQRGKLVGVVQEWDNRHLQWMLERRMPEKYHIPTRIEVAGDSDGQVNFKLSLSDRAIEAASEVSDDS